jgi:hypothetical protein
MSGAKKYDFSSFDDAANKKQESQKKYDFSDFDESVKKKETTINTSGNGSETNQSGIPTVSLSPSPSQKTSQPSEPQNQIKGIKDFGIDLKDFYSSQKSDKTYIPKPVDLVEQKRLSELHKQKVERAIDNTTAKALRLKGIKAPVNSPAYIEQKKKVQKAVDDGDATYQMGKDGEPGLNRTIGFWDSLSKGWNESINGNKEADDFVNNMNTAQRVEFANRKQKERPEDEYIGELPGALGSVGQLIGENAPFLGKAALGTAAGAGLIMAAPETAGASLEGLPAVVAFAATAPDMVYQGGMQETLRRYNILKKENPKKSEEELMSQAEEGMKVGEAAGGITNMLLMGTAGNNPISKEGKDVVGSFVSNALKSATHMGTVSAGVEAGKEGIGAAQGIKTTPSEVIENTINSFKDNATVGLALHGVISAVTGLIKVPKAVNSAFKYALKDQNPVEIQNILQANEQQGKIPPGTSQAVMTDLANYNEALGKTTDGLTPEAQASVAGLMQKRNDLSKEMSTKDFTQLQSYQDKIDALNNQIDGITKTNNPFAFEVDDITGKPLDGSISEAPVVKENNVGEHEQISPLPEQKKEGEQAYRVDYRDEKGNPAHKYFNNEEESKLFFQEQPTPPTGIEGYYEKLPKGESVEIIKTKEYDKENKPGVPSEVGVGEEPIKAQPIEGGGTQEISSSGILQAQGVGGEGKGVEPKVGEVTTKNIYEYNGKKYEVTDTAITDLETGNLKPIEFKDEVINNGKLIEKAKAELPKQTEVEKLRAEEQKELDTKIPNAEQYRVDGKVDRSKLTNEADKKAFDEVYDKYDKLITPLLKEEKVGEEVVAPKEGEKIEAPIKAEAEVPKHNKDNQPEFTTSTGRQKVNRVGDELIVTDTKTGEKVSSKTYKKAVDEYVNNFDFTHGEEGESESMEPKKATEQIVESSSNPHQLATLYAEQDVPFEIKDMTKDDMIADYGLGGISKESYRRFGDINKLSRKMLSNYIAKKGEASTTIDSLAKSISDYYFPNGDGTQISPKDLIDFMEDYESKKELMDKKNPLLSLIADKFQKLTGIKLTREVARKAINQQVEKISQEEQNLLKQDYESAKQLEDNYWRDYKATDGFAKEAPITEAPQAGEEVKGAEKPTGAEPGAAEGGKPPVPPTAEPTGEPAKPSEPAKIGKFEAKAQKIAEGIKKAELPDWLTLSDKEAKKSGLGADELKQMLADAVVNMGKLLDKGVEFSQALKESVKDLVNAHGEENRDNIEKGFEKYYKDNVGEEKVSGVKKAVIEPLRESFQLPKIELPKMGGDIKELQEAKQRVDSGESNPRQMVDDIIKNDSGYKNEKEVFDMQYYAHQLNVKSEELSKLLAEADTDIEKADVLGKKLQLSDEIDRQTEAARIAGNKWGKIGMSMQPVIDLGFNISRERNTIKEAYGGDIPKDVKEKIDSITKERDEAIAKRDKIEKDLADLKAKKEIEKKAKEIKSEGKVKKTKEEYRKERNSIVDKIKKKWKDSKGGGALYSTAIPLPIEKIKQLAAISPEVAELIKSHVEEGIDKLDDIVSSIHSLLKDEIDGITKKDIIDLISGKHTPSKERSDVAKKVAEIRSEAKKLTEKNKNNDERINDEIEKLNKKADKLEEKLKSGEIESKTKDELNIYNNTEWLKADQRVVNAEKKMRDLKKQAFESQKNWFQKGLMWAGRGIRLSVLSGYNVLYKLASAATVGAALKRIPEQAIGSIYNIAFKGIADKAPIEGSSMNLNSELKWYKEFFNPKKFVKNSWDILKSGTTYLNKKMGKGEYEHVPILYLPTDLHQIIKDPVKRGTYEASFDNAMRHAAKNGLDITNDLVVQSIQNAAFKRAEYEIFQESNSLTRKFTAFKNEMEKKGNVGAVGKFLADFMIPVSSVPTNIARRLGITSPFGLIKGSADVVKAYREGIENLTPEQADKVMRQLKQGTLGTALWLIGWFGVSHFGGLYTKFNPNKKREDEDLASDKMVIGGKEIPKPVQHALPLEVVQLAATTRRLWDKYNEDADVSTPEAIYKAGLASIGTVAESLPVLETPVHMVMATTDPYEAEKLKQDVTGRFQPQILKETGIIEKEGANKKLTDIEAKQFTPLTDRGLSLPELGNRKSIRVNVTESHPEGQMTSEEYDKFAPLVKAKSIERYNAIMENKKESIDRLQELDKKETLSVDEKMEKTQLKKEIGNLIATEHKNAIKDAKEELNLNQ